MDNSLDTLDDIKYAMFDAIRNSQAAMEHYANYVLEQYFRHISFSLSDVEPRLRKYFSAFGIVEINFNPRSMADYYIEVKISDINGANDPMQVIMYLHYAMMKETDHIYITKITD